jgi:hypothetical protein
MRWFRKKWTKALWAGFGKPLARTGEEATANKLLGMLGKCPACDADFRGHHFTLFAVTVARKRDVPRLTEFINQSKAQNWKALRGYQEFDASSNDLEAYVIRCGTSGWCIGPGPKPF